MIKTLLKLALGIGLIIWLVNSGRLDFDTITESFKNPQGIFIFFGLFSIILFLGTIRWKNLLETVTKEKLPLLTIFRVTWIGILFNTILPGAVTGDVIKLVYAKNLNKNFSNTFLISSALMDRILGLGALIFMMGIVTFLSFSELTSISTGVTQLVYFNIALFFAVVSFFTCLFLPSNIQDKVVGFFAKIPYAGPVIVKVFDSFRIMGMNRFLIVKLFSMSMIIQLIVIFNFWILVKPYMETLPGVPLDSISFLKAFSFIPTAFIVISIPLTPSGIGVGHLVFDTLFRQFGVSNGADLFNLFFMAQILINLMGLFPYLTTDKKMLKKQVEDFSFNNQTPTPQLND